MEEKDKKGGNVSKLFPEQPRKVLHLTLTKRWFALIASGEKKVEYREQKPYWEKRLFDKKGAPIRFDEIHFKNGYSKTAPFMRVEYLGIYFSMPEWAAPKHGEILNFPFFCLKLGNVLELKA